MNFNQAAIESMGYTRSSDGQSLSLNFYGCYIYTCKYIKLDIKGCNEFKYSDAHIYIGNDIAELYKAAMGVSMFIGDPSEDDFKPYIDKTCLIIKPKWKLSRNIYNYNYQQVTGGVILYDAFSDIKEKFSADTIKSTNTHLFDIKANYYSKTSSLIDWELRLLDFYGIDSKGVLYLSMKVHTKIEAYSCLRVDQETLESMFSKQTPANLKSDFISIYSTLSIDSDPYREFVVTFASMEEFICASFTSLKAKIRSSNYASDDWGTYEIITNQKLSLQQKFFLVSKYLWFNFSTGNYALFERFCSIRNDLAHRGAPNAGASICAQELKKFYFQLLTYR